MYIFGLSVFEITLTIVFILMIFVGMIGLKIRREQIISGKKTKKKGKRIGKKRNKHLRKLRKCLILCLGDST